MSSRSSSRAPVAAPPPMSLEAILDEERRAVMEILEGNNTTHHRAPPPLFLGADGTGPAAGNLAPPKNAGPPASPRWSMLDVGPPSSSSASIRSNSSQKPPFLSQAPSRTPSQTQPAPYRSMLDVSSPPSPAPAPAYRSMLDISPPPPPPSSSSNTTRTGRFSLPPSPAPSNASPFVPSPLPSPSALSTTHTSILGPPASANNARSRSFGGSDYQFGNIITATPQPVKKNAKKSASISSPASLADALRDRGVSLAQSPTVSSPHRNSRSSNGRTWSIGTRSKSPHGNAMFMANGPPSPLPAPAKMGLLDDGRVVDLSTAYRKLSDANLMRAGGGLSQLAARRMSQNRDGSPGRLVKDYIGPDGEDLGSSSDEEAVEFDEDEEEDLDDDHHHHHRDEDEFGEVPRGRGRRGRSRGPLDALDRTGSPLPSAATATATAAATAAAQSLLGAAERERLDVAGRYPATDGAVMEVEKQPPAGGSATSSPTPYQYRSLFDEPTITVTTPAKNGGTSSGPSSSSSSPVLTYAVPASSSSSVSSRGRRSSSGAGSVGSSQSRSPSRSARPVDSANNSDTEERMEAIKRAQSMPFAMSRVMHTPNTSRSSRILVRGDYRGVVEKAAAEKRVLRKYLTATDLSDEATYALEWAFGSVMRDGDTLLAVCCLNEEETTAAGTTMSKGVRSPSVAGSALPSSSPSMASLTVGPSATTTDSNTSATTAASSAATTAATAASSTGTSPGTSPGLGPSAGPSESRGLGVAEDGSTSTSTLSLPSDGLSPPVTLPGDTDGHGTVTGSVTGTVSGGSGVGTGSANRNRLSLPGRNSVHANSFNSVHSLGGSNTRAGTRPGTSPGPAAIEGSGSGGGGGGGGSGTATPRVEDVGAAERADREQIAEEVTERVLRILRKTRLQVRVIIEVVHGKHPRHLLTEMIDYLNPTLVILGSRGRSALKGVILGSFSNYLVTKSSVPTMVARKRMRKGTKYKRSAHAKQVNVLTNPTIRSLVSARID